MHARLLEERTQEDSSPFSAAGHPVRFDDFAVPGTRSVPRALDEVKAGHGRKTLQLIHGEDQLTVHQAVDHETMRLGIDVRNDGATRGPEIEE